MTVIVDKKCNYAGNQCNISMSRPVERLFLIENDSPFFTREHECLKKPDGFKCSSTFIKVDKDSKKLNFKTGDKLCHLGIFNKTLPSFTKEDKDHISYLLFFASSMSPVYKISLISDIALLTKDRILFNQAINLLKTTKFNINKLDDFENNELKYLWSKIATNMTKAGFVQEIIKHAKHIGTYDKITANKIHNNIALGLAEIGEHDYAIQLFSTLSKTNEHHMSNAAAAMARPGHFTKAVNLSNKIKDPHDKLRAQNIIIVQMCNTGLFKEATTIARSMRSDWQVGALCIIAKASKNNKLYQEAISKAMQIKDLVNRAVALCQVAVAKKDPRVADLVIKQMDNSALTPANKSYIWLRLAPTFPDKAVSYASHMSGAGSGAGDATEIIHSAATDGNSYLAIRTALSTPMMRPHALIKVANNAIKLGYLDLARNAFRVADLHSSHIDPFEFSSYIETLAIFGHEKEAIATINKPHEPLATIRDPFMKAIAFVAVARATQNPKLLKQAMKYVAKIKNPDKVNRRYHISHANRLIGLAMIEFGQIDRLPNFLRKRRSKKLNSYHQLHLLRAAVKSFSESYASVRCP